MAPGAPPIPPPDGIWQYHLINSQWSQATPGGDPMQRVLIRMAGQSSSSSVGYCLGDAVTPLSNPSFFAQANSTPYMIEGLVTFNEDSMFLTNSSTSQMNVDGPVAECFLALIESVGSQGVLIAFGGLMGIPGEPSSLDNANLAEPSIQWPLGNVSIYDIGNQNGFNRLQLEKYLLGAILAAQSL